MLLQNICFEGIYLLFFCARSLPCRILHTRQRFFCTSSLVLVLSWLNMVYNGVVLSLLLLSLLSRPLYLRCSMTTFSTTFLTVSEWFGVSCYFEYVHM